MERIDLLVKSIIAVIASFISAMVDGLGLVVTILVAFQLADIVTGIMAGFINKSLKSSVGVAGIIKKAYVLILIGVVYLFQNVHELAEFAGDGLAVSFIIIELISIVENGGKMGAPIPERLRNAIEVLKGDAK